MLGLLSASFRTGVIVKTCAISLSRGNACQTDARAFLAPDRSIAVPDMCGRAAECLTVWHDRDGAGEQ